MITPNYKYDIIFDVFAIPALGNRNVERDEQYTNDAPHMPQNPCYVLVLCSYGFLTT